MRSCFGLISVLISSVDAIVNYTPSSYYVMISGHCGCGDLNVRTVNRFYRNVASFP
jgi:hypothetical protein